jgi:hypothetical protein
MEAIMKLSDKVIAELKKQAEIFVKDNVVRPIASDFIVFETAFLTGAIIALTQYNGRRS